MNTQQVFSTLANTMRLRCLYLVMCYEEVCVCEIVETLAISQPSAPPLRALKSAGFLTDRRDANWNYYRRAEHMPDWQAALLELTLTQLSRDALYQTDAMRFVRMMG
ncbi:MAG: metalloregulator ArsR/SmtB family transcription factor [Halioglobus sp.]